MVQALTKKVTIFEGCDGSGKTTAAKRFAEATGARYVHLGPLPRVNHGLARMYAEAMLPALLGYQDVVMDRSWLSEPIYGAAFREGKDRIHFADYRMLERLALRCGAVVVLCDPGYEVVRSNYEARKGIELLKNASQLLQVYQTYTTLTTDLVVLPYDYTRGAPVGELDLDMNRDPCHPLHVQSAGNWHADTVIVGEAFGEVKDTDLLYQWPFASFSGEGCSRWLAGQLDKIEKSERDLLWLNVGQDLSVLYDLPDANIFALGEKAYTTLYAHKIIARAVEHPQYWKRFCHGQKYPLIDLL